MDPLYLILILILIGILIGILCSMVGAGGGIFFVPVFLMVFSLEPRYAVGSSVLSVTLLAFSSSMGYRRSKNVDWRIALLYNVFGSPGAVLGAWIVTQIPERAIRIICSIFLAFVSIVLFFKKESESHHRTPAEKLDEGQDPDSHFDETPKNEFSPEITKAWIEKCPVAKLAISIGAFSSMYIEYKQHGATPQNQDDGISSEESNLPVRVSIQWTWKKALLMATASFIAGIVSGLVGMGSGTILTSTLVILGVPFNLAAGSAALGIFIAHFPAVISHAVYHNILWEYGVPMGISAFIGARIGSKWATKVKGSTLRYILASFALATAVRLFL